MAGRIRDLFRVRAGEERSVTLVLALVFLVSAGGAIGGTAIEALFFARQGTGALPLLYIALGLTTLAVSVAITAILGRVGRARVYLLLPLGLAASVAVQRALMVLDVGWTYALFWLLMNVEGTLQGMLGWGVAGIVCDTRQAKRLFPLFAAGGILGGVVGGFATRPLAALLGSENLLLVWVAALGLAFVAARVLLAGRAVARSRDTASLVDEMQAGARHVRASPLWSAIAIATVLFAVLYYSIAFPFAKAAAAAYPDADELAGFLGSFGGLSTGAAFLASLFVANRLYARIGVMTAVLAFPLLYAAGFGTLLATQTAFTAVVAFRFAQLVYLQGIAGPAYESVFNVIPSERRDQVRAFVNGVPGQAGIVITGAMLLVGERALDAGQLAAIGLAAALATVLVWWLASRRYAQALVRTLRAGQPVVFAAEREPFRGFVRDATAIATARAAARDGDPRARRVAVEVLGQLPGTADALAEGLADRDADVRLAAARALARTEPDALRGALGDEDDGVRAAAAAALLDSDERARREIDELMGSPDAERRFLAVDALAATPVGGARPRLVRLAADGDPRVRARAVRAIPGAAEPESGRDEAVLGLLANAIRHEHRAVRAAASDALAAIGAPALDVALRAVDDDRAVDDALDALRRMPAAEIAGPVRDVARRRAADALRYHGLACGLRDVDERGGLVRDALLRTARRHAEIALRALAALAPAVAYDAAILGLRSRDAAQRANALETLEAVGDRALVRPLLAVFEDEGARASRTDLAALRADADPWIREVCAFATTPRPSGGASMETLATLPTMERILFLRHVPLFADLPPGDLKQIASVASEQLYEDGTVMAREGEIGNELLVIVEGTVRVVAGGNEIARRSRGEYVGEMSVIDGEPRVASLIASGSVRALRIGRRELETILRERPETSHAMLVVLARRLREMSRSAART